MVLSVTLQKLAPNPFPHVRKSNAAFWNSTKTRSKFASRASEKVASLSAQSRVLEARTLCSDGAGAGGAGGLFLWRAPSCWWPGSAICVLHTIYIYNMYSWFYRSVSLWGLDALLIAIGPDASFSRANEARTSGARGWVSIVIISFFNCCVLLCVFLLSVFISHRYGH